MGHLQVVVELGDQIPAFDDVLRRFTDGHVAAGQGLGQPGQQLPPFGGGMLVPARQFGVHRKRLEAEDLFLLFEQIAVQPGLFDFTLYFRRREPGQ